MFLSNKQVPLKTHTKQEKIVATESTLIRSQDEDWADHTMISIHTDIS